MLLPRINELPYSSSSPFVPFGILCDENEVVGWIRSVRDLVSEPGKVGYRLRRRPVKEDRPLGEKDHTVQLGEYRPGWLVDRHEARQSSSSDNLRHVRYEELSGICIEAGRRFVEEKEGGTADKLLESSTSHHHCCGKNSGRAHNTDAGALSFTSTDTPLIL